MDKNQQEAIWLHCPVCRGKTRTKVKRETVLQEFPLFCPKCKRETIVNVDQYNITVVESLTHRRRADNV